MDETDSAPMEGTPMTGSVPEPKPDEPVYAETARNLRAQARRIKELSKMTAKEIAKAAGCSASTVSKATDPDNGEDIKLGTVLSIINACGGNLELRLTRGGEPLETTWDDVFVL